MPVKPYIIGISGGSGSGKTTVASYIQCKLGIEQSTLISQDSYYHDISIHMRSVDKVNFDHPSAIEFSLFQKHLLKLKKGESVSQPIYDFVTHTRSAESKLVIPKFFIIVEGLFLFNQMKENLFNKKIYVTAPEQIRLYRRLKRDIKERGRSKESVMMQFLKTVKPMHDEYVEPNLLLANVIIDTFKNTEKEVKNIVDKLLEEIKC